MAKKAKPVDSSTEEKIKEAAKKLFTQKGFEAVIQFAKPAKVTK